MGILSGQIVAKINITERMYLKKEVDFGNKWIFLYDVILCIILFASQA